MTTDKDLRTAVLTLRRALEDLIGATWYMTEISTADLPTEEITAAEAAIEYATCALGVPFVEPGTYETVGQEEMPVELEAGAYDSDDLDRIVREADRKEAKLRHLDEELARQAWDDLLSKDDSYPPGFDEEYDKPYGGEER
jgi:hypothetical protein